MVACDVSGRLHPAEYCGESSRTSCGGVWVLPQVLDLVTFSFDLLPELRVPS